MTTNAKYETREQWLNAFVMYSREHFARVGFPLPEKVRVSVGFTSHGVRSNRIGECWHDAASQDGHFEIFLKPTIETDARMADILTHELCHAAAGLDAGHGPQFKRVANALGLVGRMTSTTASSEWYTWALPILDAIGPMPYAALADGKSSAPPKQKTSLLKVECPACGWLARVTHKHIGAHEYLNCPVPECVGVLVTGSGE
jgi:hypothetical protein